MARIFAVWTRRNVCRAGAICTFIFCLGSPAQSATSPIPDFGSDPDTSWFPPEPFGDDFLPPESGPGPVLSPPDHPYRPNDLDGAVDAASKPTYRVADLSNPILKPWAVEQMKRWNEMALNGEKIPFTARERCYPPGVPGWHVFRRVGTPMIFFVQMPKVVLMMWRGDMQVRRVYMNVPHSRNPKPSWHGESVGHYEGGDTLVVDTIGLLAHPLSFVDNYRTPHTEQLHVVERFRLSDGGKRMEVKIHVEDPGAFTTPWNAVQRLERTTTRGSMQETSCAELGLTPGGDYFGLQAVPIPQSERPDF